MKDNLSVNEQIIYDTIFKKFNKFKNISFCIKNRERGTRKTKEKNFFITKFGSRAKIIALNQKIKW